jgi:DNA-binding beta-propeller fold protein YncE
MRTPRSNSKLAGKGWEILALLLAVLMCGTPAPAKKKPSANAPAEAGPKRVTFDISKIVWPSPPDIARLRFQQILTGEKINWEGLQPNPKPKQSWMDRLAGEEPDRRVKDVQKKVGFQLLRVFGVAADSKGNIYAADQGVGAIFIFPKSDTEPVRLIKHGVDARLPMINGLAVDDDDRLFVTDVKLHHVLVFNAQHEQEASFGADQLLAPAGVAIDTSNRFVYVVDTQADQVVVFDADKYTLLRRMGTGGKKHSLTSPGDFALPTHVAVDKEGNVYVTDTLNNRVEIFDADGGFINEFGKAGDGPGRFARPKGIAIDGDGHIWVTDEIQSRVQVFDKEGRLLLYMGEQGWYPGQFRALYGIAADNYNNRIITSEQFPGRVQVFRYVTDAEAEAERARRAAGEKPGQPKSAAPKLQNENAPGKVPGTPGS